MIFDPGAMAHGDVYKLAIGSIIPRPIAFVSTRSEAGVDNLAPFSFFTVVCANPLTLCFSPMRKGPQALEKDTLVNIRATGEFIIHVVDEDFAERMNVCSAEVDPDVSEFDLSGLTRVPAETVKPRRVLESPVAFECKLLQIVDVSSAPGGGSLVMGTVQRIHVRDELLDRGRIKLDAWKPIGRLAGNAYSRVNDTFDMVRPSAEEALTRRQPAS